MMKNKRKNLDSFKEITLPLFGDRSLLLLFFRKLFFVKSSDLFKELFKLVLTPELFENLFLG